MSKGDSFQTIVFDFDYTLADSSRGIIESINFALVEMGFPAASEDAVCKTIGQALPKAFVQLAGMEYADRSDRFVALFKQRADQVMTAATMLYPTVPATVEKLKRERYKLAIVSNKFRYRIEAVLQREQLLADFDTIVGSEDFTNLKPDPEGLRTAMARLSTQPASTLYVGDSLIDAETATNAGTRFVAVLTGVTPRDEFAPYHPYAIIPDLSALPALLG